MKRWMLTTIFLGLLLSGCGTFKGVPAAPHRDAHQPVTQEGGTRHYPGQLLVGYRSEAALKRAARAIGATIEEDFAPLRIALLSFDPRLPLEKAKAIAEHVDGIRYAQANKLYTVPPVAQGSVTTNSLLRALARGTGDPDLGKQWMHRQLHTPAAWAKGVTGRGIRIGIHDTFMDYNHPDLKANVAFPGFYGTTGKIICPDTPYNGQGEHGTMVAGTAAAVGHNGIGGRGVAYEAQVVPLSIDDPEDGSLTTIGIVRAALFAVLGPDGLGLQVPEGCQTGTPPSDGGPYVDIVNMSWGGSAYDQITKDVMDFMLMNGVILVTSAGNTPTTGFADPAWLPGLITVAATEANGQRTNFSNRGLHLTVAAPGENIWTTETRQCLKDDPTGQRCPPDEADYGFVNGTSFSSPATSGVAALVLQAAGGRGSLDARQVRAILSQTAWDVQGDGYDEDLGWGIVDADKAVTEALKIKNGERTPPDPGANVRINVVDANTGTPLPEVGVTLERLDSPRAPELQFSQTTGTGLFSDMGRAYFLQIDPGQYRVHVGGPSPDTGVAPDAATVDVTVQPGFNDFTVQLNVQLPQDPYEPNDTTSDATAAVVGKTYNGILYSSGDSNDVDVFKVNLHAGTTYYFNTETRSGTADLLLQIYDAEGTLLDENHSNQDFTDDALLVFTPPSDGDYYLVVSDEQGGNSPFNAYALDLAVLVGQEHEPNGDAEVSGQSILNLDVSQAETLPLGSAIEAAIDPGNDVDVFAVELPAGVPVVADTEAISSGKPDTMLAIFDAEGNQVAFNDDYTGRESRLTYTPDAAGTYYVVVVSWDGGNPENATTGSYTLSVTELDQPASPY